MPTRPPDAVLAPPTRRPAGVLAGAAAAALVAFAVGYAGVQGPGRLDARIDPVIQRVLAPVADELWWVVRLVGPVGVAVVACGLAVTCLVLGRRRLAMVVLAGPLLTGIATVALKPLVGRTLDGHDALPSGHTGGATAMAAAAALVAVRLAEGGRVATVLALLGTCAAGVTMAAALVANGLHFTSDTVAGLCTALAVVLGTALAVDAGLDRSGPTRSRSPSVSS